MSCVVVDANVWVAATDRRVPHYADSTGCLVRLRELDWKVLVPSLAKVEVACALARLFQNPAQARRITGGLLRSFSAAELPLDSGAVERAQLIGTEQYLRAADAIYAAEAVSAGIPLISWDGELIKRAGAMSPSTWLLTHA